MSSFLLKRLSILPAFLLLQVHSLTCFEIMEPENQSAALAPMLTCYPEIAAMMGSFTECNCTETEDMGEEDVAPEVATVKACFDTKKEGDGCNFDMGGCEFIQHDHEICKNPETKKNHCAMVSTLITCLLNNKSCTLDAASCKQIKGRLGAALDGCDINPLCGAVVHRTVGMILVGVVFSWLF